MRSDACPGGRRPPVSYSRYFVLQWHLTARCGENCGHCYARGSPDRKRQLEEELDLADCRKVLDSFSTFVRDNGLRGRINITGGDPLLKEGLIDLVREARRRGLLVGILGNPANLDLSTARELKGAGVFRYQLSMDGLEGTHDAIRGRRGHFSDTLEALGVLNRVDLPSVVMFTVSATNAGDLPDVARLAADMDVRIFDFARLVPQGRGREMDMVGPLEYRRLLERMLETYRELEGREDCRTHFGRKEPLWNLLHLERGELDLPKWDGRIHSGCSAGSKVLTVLADGTVYPCRRLPLQVGRLPGDDLEEVFLGARTHMRLRDVSNFEKCRGCELLPYCRGCPGVTLGASGDPYGPDPQCWRQLPEDEGGASGSGRGRTFDLEDFSFWSAHRSRACTSCDGACGGCGHVCAACSEVCAGCGGYGDI